MEVLQLTIFGLFWFGTLGVYVHLRRSKPEDRDAISAYAAQQGLDVLGVKRKGEGLWRLSPVRMFTMSNVARIYQVEARRAGVPSNFVVAIDPWPGCASFRVLQPPR